MTTVQQEFHAAFGQHQSGDLDDAEARYRRLLRRDPRHGETLYLLGSLLTQRGRYADAILFLKRAIGCDPSQARFHNNLGIALKETRQFDEALEAYHQALGLQSDYPEVFNNIGILYRCQDNLEEAIPWYKKAIAAQPGYAEAHNNLGIALKEEAFRDPKFQALGEVRYEDMAALDEAREHFREAARAQPDFAPAHNNLGTVLRLQRRYEEAILSVERALRLQPDSEEAQQNSGILLYLMGYYQEAEARLLHVLKLYPDARGTLCGLGDCARMQGRHTEALAYFDQFLANAPEDVEAQYARGQILLQLGDVEQGWPGYEWRLRRPSSPQRAYTQPRWDGSPLAGRTLLVHAEQGFGDQFQFVRYLSVIPKDGGKVIFECQPGTRDLLERCMGFDELIERPKSNKTEGNVLHDVQVALMSLAYLFPHLLEAPPGRQPYIHADPAQVTRWGKRLSQFPTHRPGSLKVGLIWAGNPNHGNDHNRSASLADFAPLARVPGVTLYSLQKGHAESQTADPPAGMTVVDLAPEIETFADTAAILDCLDVLISVDTSTAHLAGAMGRPTWLLLPLVPEWRWLDGRDDTPWYPSMRLFRQPRLKDWASVLAQVADEITEIALAPLLPRIEVAETQFASGDVAGAKAALQALADSGPPHPRVLNNLGVLYWHEGAPAAALAAFQSALEIAPHDQATRLNCAEVLRAFGHQEDAERLAA